MEKGLTSGWRASLKASLLKLPIVSLRGQVKPGPHPDLSHTGFNFIILRAPFSSYRSSLRRRWMELFWIWTSRKECRAKWDIHHSVQWLALSPKIKNLFVSLRRPGKYSNLWTRNESVRLRGRDRPDNRIAEKTEFWDWRNGYHTARQSFNQSYSFRPLNRKHKRGIITCILNVIHAFLWFSFCFICALLQF